MPVNAPSVRTDSFGCAFSLIGLGCARVGSFNNPQSLAESQALVEAAIGMGVTLLDTANIYGQGDSERVIGRALRGKRASAFLVTKAGQTFSPKMRALRLLKPVLRPLLARRRNDNGGGSVVTARRAGEMRNDWRPGHLAESLDTSLRRLGTDHVDAFLLHSPPADVAGDEAVAAALLGLQRAGKTRHFGVSCDDLACLDAALTMPGLTLLQLPYDLSVAAEANGMGDRIRAQGIGVLAREVISGQPGAAPVAAVRAAMAHPLVTSTLVGTTRLSNLSDIVRAAGEGPHA